MPVAVGFNPRWRHQSGCRVATVELRGEAKRLKRRSATHHTYLQFVRGLKPAATLGASLREAAA